MYFLDLQRKDVSNNKIHEKEMFSGFKIGHKSGISSVHSEQSATLTISPAHLSL